MKKRFFLRHQQVQGNCEPFFRFSNTVHVAKSLLDGNRDHMLAEAKSDILKQELKWMLLTLAFVNFNDKHSHRLELDSANCRYEESRREQARLHEELAQREKHFEIPVSEISMKWKNWRKLRKCEFTNSLNSNWEKVMVQYRSSHHRSKSCKRGGICEWLKRISTYRIDLQWKIISRSQSADSRSKSSIYVEPRPKPAIWYMEFVWGHRETFLAIHEQFSNHHRHLIKDFFTLLIKVLQVESPCRGVQRDLSRKGEKQIGSTVPMPCFARRPATMISFSPAEIPQNSMEDQQRLQISELHFDKFPTHSTFFMGE